MNSAAGRARSRAQTRSSRCSGTWIRSLPEAHVVQGGGAQRRRFGHPRQRHRRAPSRLLRGRCRLERRLCAEPDNSVSSRLTGPGVGTPDPCIDNQFHGTHVAGTVAAQANGIGIVGVAPNVTLVPVKTCDASGYCYASAVVDAITDAGDAKLDVINTSFFVDDDEFQQSTEFKCTSDPTQRSFKEAVERALRYAVKRGVAPVAALGNSDQDLANPKDENGNPISNEREVVPAESPGVIGTTASGTRARSRRTRTTGSAPPTSPHRAATARRATALRRSSRRCRAAPTAASRGRRWPRRTRRVSPR